VFLKLQLKRVNDVGEYVKIAEIEDVLKNQMQVFNAKGQKILVINVEGELFAIENRCPHMGYPLFFGSLEGDVLTCGFHSAKFNVKTGKALGPVTSERLKTFPVKIQNSSIFIEV
jgi:nitrite reductase/ring-hydroxylating ferredoxin subunit